MGYGIYGFFLWAFDEIINQTTYIYEHKNIKILKWFNNQYDLYECISTQQSINPNIKKVIIMKFSKNIFQLQSHYLKKQNPKL